jgi:cell division septum initiation protein DivIVA
MTDPAPQFRVVLRGYEPAQVDRRLEELGLAVQEAARQRDELYLRVQALEEEKANRTDEMIAAEPVPATFEHLGERVGQILSLAEDEAADLRKQGEAEIAAKQAEVVEQIGKIKGEADRYAAGKRTDAETEAARILEDARRLADERIDGADRDAAARIQEAEAIYEEQRARAAKVAADFETTLATRRKAAEAELAQQLSEANSRLEEASRLVDQARADADALHADATREARRILDDADLQASTMVNDAKTLAARVRSDSDRELAAATQRRDSINAQLANVRQMLATLTGTNPAGLDPFEAVAEETDAETPEDNADAPEVPGQPQPEHDQDLVEAKE